MVQFRGCALILSPRSGITAGLSAAAGEQMLDCARPEEAGEQGQGR